MYIMLYFYLKKMRRHFYACRCLHFQIISRKLGEERKREKVKFYSPKDSPEKTAYNRHTFTIPSHTFAPPCIVAVASPSRHGQDATGHSDFAVTWLPRNFATKVFAQRASSDFPVHQSIGLTHRAEYKRARCIPTCTHSYTNARHIDGLRARGPLQGDAKFRYFYSGLSHRDAT